MMMTEKEIMRLANGSDIRGIALKGVEGEKINFTAEAANRIATGFVKFLSEQSEKFPSELKIAVGHDPRISSEIFKKAIFESLSAAGVKIFDCGLASTPAMFMSNIFQETNTDGSIMITASHLPFNRNGLKFFTKMGGIEHENVTTILKYACAVEEIHSASNEEIEKINLIEIYSKHLCNKIRKKLGAIEKPFEGMHIIVDAGNGSGGFFATKVLKPLGADISGSQFLEPNGKFPHHMPNPEDEEAMKSLQKAVLENKADLGLIFDTDVDRMSAVLSDGKEICRDSLIAMIAAIIAQDYPHSTIVTDSVTSDDLTIFLEQELGLHHIRYMRGYRNVINKCIELNLAGITSPLAIETSGHGALRENYYLDDGAYLSVKILIAAAKARKNKMDLSHLIEKLNYPAEMAEFRLKIKGVENFRAYGNKILSEFQSRAIDRGIEIAEPNFEGVRLNFGDDEKIGSALLRMSLHEPKMPLNVESKFKGGLKKIIAEIKNLLNDFEHLDISSLD